jgi:hypothetical protein
MSLAARYRAACAALGLRVWRPGMPALDGLQFWSPGAEPDLTSPAGKGCLLATAREAWAAPTLFVRPTASGWTVMRGSGAGKGKLSDGRTEADALIAALEAAAARRGGQP